MRFHPSPSKKTKKEISKSQVSIKRGSPPHALVSTKHDNYNNLYLIVSNASFQKNEGKKSIEIKRLNFEIEIKSVNEYYKSFLFINDGREN